jgi:threonine/homoserine/homoserine lactone efflux protein
MSVAPTELFFYALAMVVLTITPGPVWVATIARGLAGGFAEAWPLTLGVALGDVLWSVLALFGMGWAAATFGDVMAAMRWVAAGLFLFLGVTVLRHARDPVGRDSRLTRPGRWAGFAAGVVVILSNPKAILFYMGFLPGFFDLTRLTGWDVAAIACVSFAVPLAGNLALAGLVGRMRGLLSSPKALRRINAAAGVLLVSVGLVIPFL